MKIVSILLALAVAATCMPATLEKRVSGLELYLYAEQFCHKPSVFLTCYNVHYGSCCSRRNAVSGRFAKGYSGGSNKLFADEVLYGYSTSPGAPACYKDIDTSLGRECVYATRAQGRIMTGVKVNKCSACRRDEIQKRADEGTGCVEATHFTANGTQYQISDMDEGQVAWMDSFFE